MSPGTKEGLQEALLAAAARLLKPLVRILVRYGIPYRVFADVAKRAYVEVARGEFTIDGRKQTLSRVAVLTGLSRKEVRRVLSLPQADDSAAVARYNRAARVISGWARDPAFRDRAGRPAALPFEDPQGQRDFHALVRRYSGDMPARAVLDELERVGAVERTRDGRIRLAARAYVPQQAETDKLTILGTDAADLIACIDHNLQASPDRAFFQRKVAYDNLPAEALEEIRRLASERSQRVLEDLDALMSASDRDTNPNVQGSGRKRVVLGIYYLEHDTEDGDET